MHSGSGVAAVQASVVSSAARACGQKRFGVANNGKKVTP